jgi:mannosyltransferase
MRALRAGSAGSFSSPGRSRDQLSCTVVHQTRRQAAFVSLLVLLTAAGAVLRLWRLGEPSLWLDEILNVNLLAQFKTLGWWRWLGGLEPENGPLYFFLHRISYDAIHPEWSWRIPAVVAGIASIPLIGLTASRLTQRWIAGAVAAALLAISPFHIFYSREGRPYALLILFCIVALNELARSAHPRSLRLALIALASLYVAATAVPLVIGIAAVALVPALVARQRGALQEARSWLRACLLTAASLIVILPLYLRFPGPGFAAGFDLSFRSLALSLMHALSTSIHGPVTLTRFSVAMALAALVGGVLLLREQRRAGLIVIGMTLVPLAVALSALVVMDHWFSPRYAALALPGYIIALSIFIDAAGRFAARGAGRLTKSPAWHVAAAGLVLLVLLSTVVAHQIRPALTDPFRRSQWRELASALWNHGEAGDTIVMSNSWTTVSLSFYLDRLPPKFDIRPVGESIPWADYVVGRRERSWLVSGGFHRDESITHWFCRYPLLASDPIEEVRIHYAPDLSDFLTHRATAATRQRLREMLEMTGGRIGMTAADEVWLKDGFYEAEGDPEAAFRWSRQRASLVLPDVSVSAVRMEVRPFDQEGAELRLTLDGIAAGTLQLEPDWKEYLLELPPPLRNQPVRTIGMELSSSGRPSDSGLEDRRELGAAFAWIELVSDRAQAVATPGLPAFEIRLDQAPLPMREPFASDDSRVIISAADPQRLRVLLLRLGLDAAALEEPLSRGAVGLNQLVAASLLPPGACQSDSEFLGRSYRLLLGRPPDPPGLEHYLKSMRSGLTRERLLHLLISGDEFRDWLRGSS